MLGRLLITLILYSPIAAVLSSYSYEEFRINAFLSAIAIPMVAHLIIEFFNKKSEKEKSLLIRTPENERIVLEYLRSNNIRLVGYANHKEAVKKMSLKMFECFLRTNNNRTNNNDSKNIPELKPNYINIPEDYINIKDFKNIEVYDNGNNYLVKPLKWQHNNSLYRTNDATIISKDAIISNLHLHYLLTVIDTAIGE